MAKVHKTGKQCGRAAIKGATVCQVHGGAAPQVKAAAAKRLRDLQPKVIVAYEDALDQKDDLPSRIRAADSVAKLTTMGDLDRALLDNLDPGRQVLPNDVLDYLLELAGKQGTSLQVTEGSENG